MGLSLVGLKGVLGLVMVTLTLAFGLLPIRVLKYLRKQAALRRSGSASPEPLGDAAAEAGEDAASSVLSLGKGSRWPGLVLCLLSCFTGGVFLGTCFLHLLPEVNEHLARIKDQFHWDSDYPLGELISCLGFFLIFFVEEIVVSFLQGGHGHSHGAQLRSDSPVLVHVHGTDGPGDRSGLQSPGGRADEAAETSETTALNASDVRLRVNGKGIPYPNVSLSPNAPQRTSTIDQSHSASKFSTRAASPFSEVFTSLEVAEPERCEGPCEGQDEDPPILITSRPHLHSHGVRSVTLVLALSFHSVVEGIALGIADSRAEATNLFLSLIVHKVIVAFSVGLQLGRTHAHQLGMVLASMVVLALTTPLGMLVGTLVQTTAEESLAKELALLVFEGAAVGTFLYVTFFEVLIHERDNEHPNLLKLLLMIAGFGLIAALALMEHGHDSHDHQHPPSTPAIPQTNSTTNSTAPQLL